MLELKETLHGEKEDIVQLSLCGSVDAYTCEKLNQQMEDYLDSKKIKLIIDCKELEFINSSGMGVFMALEDDFIDAGGGIKIVNLVGKILKVFSKIGLTDILKIYENIDLAIEDYEKGI